ncbi:hypothetical protein [Flagellimonas marina]|uniref:Late embryogenesis abundant protein LEA-2 subgroup domain-containing protein n=1 Tax=Flagellimonas marina TaxID=1775168 RepID=A0ABV8PIY2_9FLAO
MKIKTKHILLGGLAIVAGFSIWGGKKAYDINSVAQKVKISLRGFKLPELFGLSVRSKVNVALANPTATPLDVSTGGLVTLTTIRVYNKENRLVATANPGLTNISIPAYSEVVVQDIPIESNVTSILNTLLIGSTNAKDYRVEAEISALGRTFTI